MKPQLEKPDLENRIKAVISRIGFFPKEQDEYYLRQVPYWNDLIEAAKQHGDFFPFLNQSIGSDFFNSSTVNIPSLEQKLVGANIATRKRVLELSKPGTRKTIAALSAIVPIEQKHLKGEKLKTFVTCPGYIIPNWITQIENLFVDPNIAVVTSQNRDKSIARAAEDSTDFVIVGYDMTFRDAARNGNGDIDWSSAHAKLSYEIRSLSAAYNRLNEIVGSKKTKLIQRRKLGLPDLITEILKEDIDKKVRESTGSVINALMDNAFKNKPYYAIVDEFHNIVHDKSKRATAIKEITIPAEYLVLISGTGIGKDPKDLDWASQVLGFSNRSGDFKKFIAEDTQKKVRAFLQQYAIHPIRTLEDIDPDIPKPIEIEKPYDISNVEIELFTKLMETDEFDGSEKYRLFQYLVSNHHKLLPEKVLHSDGDDPIYDRIRSFFNSNPGLEQQVRESEQSRINYVKQLVQEVKDSGKKCLIACHYKRDTTPELEKALSDLGVRRIDQDASPDIIEIALTSKEKKALKTLKDEKLFRGDEVYRSDLTPAAKKLFQLGSHEIYGMSDREILLHEFATNPDISALASTRCLREGIELKEADIIINFEDTTIPSWKEQYDSRTIRSGQRKKIELWNIRSPLLSVVEDYVRNKRLSRQDLINKVLASSDTDPKNLEEWAASNGSTEDSLTFAQLTARQIIGEHFNKTEGLGSISYSQEILHNNNAMFIAGLYSRNRENTTSGNIAQLTRDVILGIQTRKGKEFKKILDAGCGPLAVATSLGRATIGVDMNKFQMHYGKDNCEQHNEQSTCYLGDITDLSTLIPFDEAPDVFEPGRQYEKTTKIKDGSVDLVVASLVVDLLDKEGRHKFLNESNRVIGNGYLGIIVPDKRIAEECKKDFISDVESYGFTNQRYFTGTYRGFRGDNPEKVEAYVMVFAKTDEVYNETQANLSMLPDYKILDDVDPKKDSKKGNRRGREEQEVSSDRFIRVDDRFDLNDVKPEPPDYIDDISSSTSKLNSDDVNAAARKLDELLGGM